MIVVVEELGGSPRKRRETGRLEPPEVVLQRQPERRRSLPDLEGGVSVYMQLGEHLLDRTANVEVEVAGEPGMDAALQADLGGAAVPGLFAAADDLVERDEVGRPAEVGRQLPLGERAEPAAEVADVRVVDVAGDDVGDRVAADLAAELVGSGDDGREVLAAGAEQLGDVVFVELDLPANLRQSVTDRRRDGRQPRRKLPP